MVIGGIINWLCALLVYVFVCAFQMFADVLSDGHKNALTKKLGDGIMVCVCGVNSVQ